MRRTIIITDLSRMKGSRVCVAGYDYSNRVHIRPIIPYEGIHEHFLFESENLIIKPFAIIEFDGKICSKLQNAREGHCGDLAGIEFRVPAGGKNVGWRRILAEQCQQVLLCCVLRGNKRTGSAGRPFCARLEQSAARAIAQSDYP